jgi:hypothetical protein
LNPGTTWNFKRGIPGAPESKLNLQFLGNIILARKEKIAWFESSIAI